jgi:hypothetical protein
VQQGPGPRPFDVTPRTLIESDPAGWLAWVGLPVNGEAHAIESEVSTVLAEVNKVVRVEAASPWLAHFELQSARDPDLPVRLLQYHALLLRPAANGPELSGLFESHGATGDLTVSFRFRVVRLWEHPVEELLNGSLGVLPLAPLAAVAPADLPDVFHRVNDRLTRDADPGRADLLWAAMTLLLDLRYDRASLREILREMRTFRDSVAAQILVEEGRLEEARRLVVSLGSDRLGPPDTPTREMIERIDDLDSLERLIRRTFTAPSWQELLAEATGR